MSFLLLQGWLGARFFVRPSWDIFPEIEHWDYHPAMAPADVENPEGVVDCVICLERIELRHTSSYPQGDPDVEDEHERDPLLDKTRESLDAGRLFGRYSYMARFC